ncbi:hypothetical protein KDW54_06975 [Burkholderia ambifaria]|uniref:hypothetical protein n=1 Tax=Burkholderia ambifaria TaxID=152480 RepID=UPI001B923DD4|nr:hypothetical protein [Burkholderia ambifaria]MBR8182138.1 hypothetical protein [Burkholderia ambifaria]
MSRRTYPRIGMDRKRKVTKLCNCCTQIATWQVEFQVDWFRGDDECFLLCDKHHELVADMNLVELNRLKADENARRRAKEKEA